MVRLNKTQSYAACQYYYLPASRRQYQNRELHWRPKTAKKYKFTTKVIVLGGWPPSKTRQV